MCVRLFILTAAIAAVGPLGCIQHTRPIIEPQSPSRAQQNFEAVWDASCRVLREHHFDLEVQDRRAGLITTEPLVGRHFFEFWRDDAATPTDVVEGTLQTLARQVEVSIQADPQNPQQYFPNVQVQVLRSDEEVPQVTNTSEAYGLVGTGRRESRPEGAPAVASDAYVPLGRDEQLENLLAEKIRQRAAEILAPPETEPWYRRFYESILGQEVTFPEPGE